MNERDRQRQERKKLSDRELLELIHDRLDDGDAHFARIDADWTLAMNFMHEVALERGREDLAKRIRETVIQRRPNGNVDFHEEPTNPDIK